MGPLERLKAILHPKEPALRARYKTEYPAQDAFGELWAWYEPRVFRKMCTRILWPNGSDAEDALHDSIVKLCSVEARALYNPAMIWFGWASTIVARAAINILRDRAVRDGSSKYRHSRPAGNPPARSPQRDNRPVVITDIADPGPSPPDVVMDKEIARAVEECLQKVARLEPVELAAMIESFQGPEAREKFREEHGVVPATITKWKQKAIRKLKECLAEKGHEGERP
jgi:DNA-directed RNA polymerase specialized sigma24 family protein